MLYITLPGNSCYVSLSGTETAGALPKTPKKLSLSWVLNGGEVMKLLRVATSSGSIYSLFLTKTRMLSSCFLPLVARNCPLIYSAYDFVCVQARSHFCKSATGF